MNQQKIAFFGKALANHAAVGLTDTFKWYSRPAATTLETEIIGSFQPDVYYNVYGKIQGYMDDTSNMILYTDTFIDGASGIFLETGDILYKQITDKKISLGPSKPTMLGPFVYPGSLSITDVSGGTTYTENTDYKINYMTGYLQYITRHGDDGNITDDVEIDFESNYVLSDTEITSNVLALEDTAGVYASTGYYLSPPFSRWHNSEWMDITAGVSYISAITEIVVTLFPGSATNAEMIAGTGALSYDAAAKTEAGGIMSIALDYSGNTTDFDDYITMRMKIAITTPDTSQTPTVNLEAGSNPLSISLKGAKLLASYQYDRFIVEKVNTHSGEVRLKREVLR